jgi:glycosyltransferase involved in cell wall biosynthesis
MAGTLPLSLVVITRDAAKDLAGCLASAPFASEIVVVDAGSRDDTVDIARRSGARVLEERWRGFGPQKRFAVDAAAHDWVLCLDADERARPSSSAPSAAAFAGGEPGPPAFAFARRNRFLGRWLAHGEGYPDWNVRLFDRRRARWSDDPVHEHVLATARSRASTATCCTRRPSRSTTTSRSRTATRRCRPRRCTRAASAPGSRGSRCRRSRASCASTS